jgi:hypothetical protein
MTNTNYEICATHDSCDGDEHDCRTARGTVINAEAAGGRMTRATQATERKMEMNTDTETKAAQRISALLGEAVAAGDQVQEALCRLALDEDISGLGCVDALIDSPWAECTPEDARAECIRVIDEVAS